MVGNSGGSPRLLVVPKTLHQASTALEQLATTFHDEIVQLSAQGDAVLGTWKGRAGPTFVEPFDEWKRGANDVVERLKAAAVLIMQAKTAYVAADGS